MHHETPKSQVSERAPETKGRTIRCWARFYDVGSWLLSLGRAPAIRKTALRVSGVAPGDKLLDVGCGTGSLAIAAKGKVGPAGKVHGIDAAPEMIQVAREKAAKARVDIAFQVGLIEEIPFADGHFDLALNSFVLHHLPEELKRKGFAEIRRVLKPGGRFLAVDFAPRSDSLIGHLVSLLGGHGMTRKDAAQLMAMMEEAGFTEVEEVKTKHRHVLFLYAKAAKPALASEA